MAYKMISVLIFTKNEAFDLPGCLDSLKWCDDIHVFDSCSTDNTVQIANSYGAKVVTRNGIDYSVPFGGNESDHRNWALNNINFLHKWVYHCDADERLPPETVSAMYSAINSSNDYVAYRLMRHDYFMNTWLKHVTPSPFNIRLFKIGKIFYERVINPVPVVTGRVATLDAHFDHYPFSKGIGHWINKHNDYSFYEARHIHGEKTNFSYGSLKKSIFSTNPNERRKHQKEIYYLLPARPILMFLLLYFFRFGFLDGKAGFVFSVLRSIYELFIVLKVNELES